MENNKNIRAVKGTASHRNVADSMAESMMPEDLAKMKDVDIREAEAGKLADILEIEIDKDISDIIRQIRNPYLYRQGEYIVKLSFADTDATLADRLKEYIEHMATAGL